MLNGFFRLTKQFCSFVVIFSLISLFSIIRISPVNAEASWKPGSSTPPRMKDFSVNFKSAPCRDFSRTKRVKVYKPGDPVLAQWLETRDHFGVFQFNLLQINTSAGLDEFVMPIFSDVVDDINGVITGDQYHEFQKNFILPTRLATGASIIDGDYVLQLIHLTTSQNAPADPVTNPVSKYYSCSDIRLENINANDVTAPDNVSNFNLVYSSKNLELDWLNPVSNGVVTENLAYKVLLLVDQTAAITVTTNQLANREFTVGDIFNQTTQVVYVGNGELFNLVNSNVANHYFKIFSYDVNGNYASGMSTLGPNVRIAINQGAITDANLLKVNNGNITVRVSVSSNIASETYSFDWTQDRPSSLVDVDGVVDDARFEINSSALTVGEYVLQLKIKSSTGLISTVMQNLSLAENNNGAPQNPVQPAIAKKIDVGGCTLVADTVVFDPVLLLLLLIAMMVVIKNNQRKSLFH